MKELATKIVAIMDECRYVQKTGQNTFHGYKYATAADVLDKVNAALVKHRVAVFPVAEITDFRDTVNSKGNTEHLATVKTTLTIVDSDSGQSTQTVGFGSGQDIGDKAVMKAQTASMKYAWMMFLQISTGDDPEADPGVDQRSSADSQSTGKKAPSTGGNSSTPPASSTPSSSGGQKKLSESQINRFYSIVKAVGATNDEAKFVQDSLVPKNRDAKGKFIWDTVTKAQYDLLCNAFEKGTWKTMTANVPNVPSLAASGGAKL
jgi:hypothetical protein